ncbi:hypothetical protein PVAP13_1NG399719 [Panicum virgatum]|uniref:Uncharacterized protein n=1 Tax=Panicum virgatum TaxID=38727 RepID=A0A8T0WTX0_PANVG|nr:hypothetical protein PVAP13_1NG399719 [Panicum virgatum]
MPQPGPGPLQPPQPERTPSACMRCRGPPAARAPASRPRLPGWLARPTRRSWAGRGGCSLPSPLVHCLPAAFSRPDWLFPPVVREGAGMIAALATPGAVARRLAPGFAPLRRDRRCCAPFRIIED